MRTRIMIGSGEVLKDAETLAAEAISKTFSNLYACSDVEEMSNDSGEVEIIQVEGIIPHDNEISDVEAANAIAKILSTETSDEEKKEAVTDLVENVVADALEETGEISDENVIKKIAELLADKVEDAIEEHMEDNVEPSEDSDMVEESCKESKCNDEVCVDEEVSEVSYVTPGMEDKAAALAKQREEVRKKLEMEKAIAKDRGNSNYQANEYMKKGAYASAPNDEEGDDYIAAESNDINNVNRIHQEQIDRQTHQNATDTANNIAMNNQLANQQQIHDNAHQMHIQHMNMMHMSSSGDEEGDDYIAAEKCEANVEDEDYKEGCGHSKWDYINKAKAEKETDDEFSESVPGESGYAPEPMFTSEESVE